MNKLIIGSHVSFNKEEGLLGSVKESLNYEAKTFMIYTGAPQNTKRSEINIDNTKQAQKLMQEKNIDINNVIIHAPYIINLANNKDKSKYNFSINFLKEELKRAQTLGVKKVVMHPGSHVGLGIDQGLKNIIEALNQVLDTEKGPIICLETMAGKGTELGKTLEEIKTIIEGTKNSKRLQVCLDTCHLNDAGYDLTKFDELLEKFDQQIGINKIGCIHINDSKNIQASHKDRHENIGLGTIGFQNLIKIVYNEKLKEVPKILETPYVKSEKDKKTYPPYKQEIEMIKQKKYNKNLLTDIINYYSKS